MTHERAHPGSAEMTHRADGVLLDAVYVGDSGALQGVWTRYGDVAYWAAASLTGDTTVATDAVVAAFGALGRSAGAARRPLPQHLIAAVRRRCPEPGTSSTARSTLVEDEGAAACRTAIRNLSDQQLTIVALIMSGRFCAREAASAVGVSRAEVCALLGEVLTTLAASPPVSSANS